MDPAKGMWMLPSYVGMCQEGQSVAGSEHGTGLKEEGEEGPV